MTELLDATLSGRWFPVCGTGDVPPRHVAETELLERELAVWRSASGAVNVWANRCPHRGMRLSVGVNLGGELRCAYHGYRFAEQTGQCTVVPAQPDRTPPRSLCVTTFPVAERHGLVWTRLAPGAGEPQPWPEATRGLLALYSIPVNASVADVVRRLLDYRFRPGSGVLQPDEPAATCRTRALDSFTLESVATMNEVSTTVRFFLQPVAPTSTIIHARLLGPVPELLRPPTLRHHAARLGGLRAAAERWPTPRAAARSGPP